MNLNTKQQEKYEIIVKKLKNKSIKLTEIRSKVIKLIILAEHINIQQLISKLEKSASNINVTSVYNTIDLLLKEHIVFSNTFDGKNIWYELSTNKSVHIKCDSCGDISHVSESKLENYSLTNLKDFLDDKDAHLEHIKIELHVICKKCYL